MRREEAVAHLIDQDIAGAIGDPAAAILAGDADEPLVRAVAVQVAHDEPRVARAGAFVGAVGGHPGHQLVENSSQHRRWR